MAQTRHSTVAELEDTPSDDDLRGDPICSRASSIPGAARSALATRHRRASEGSRWPRRRVRRTADGELVFRL